MCDEVFGYYILLYTIVVLLVHCCLYLITLQDPQIIVIKMVIRKVVNAKYNYCFYILKSKNSPQNFFAYLLLLFFSLFLSLFLSYSFFLLYYFSFFLFFLVFFLSFFLFLLLLNLSYFQFLNSLQDELVTLLLVHCWLYYYLQLYCLLLVSFVVPRWLVKKRRGISPSSFT